MPAAIIVRGLPKTGKTDLAKQIASRDPNSFLIDHRPNPFSDPEFRKEWLLWCEALANRRPLVVVTEPSPQVEQINRYVRAAQRAGYEVSIVRSPLPEEPDPISDFLLDIWEDHPEEVRALPEIEEEA